MRNLSAVLVASEVPHRLTAWRIAAAIFLGAAAVSRAGAQDSENLSSLAVRFASLTAVTGYEDAAVDTVLRLLPGAVRDRGRNVRVQLGGGSGSRRRLVLCPLDEPGYVVGRVREDGYLLLRRVPGLVPLLFDQQLEGHRVTIQGAKGPVPGAVAVRSVHLTRGRQGPPEAPFTVDEAFVDVGAGSPAEVERIGVRVLSPVTLTKRPHRYGQGLLAAPMAGRRTACAALLLAVTQARARARALPPVTVAFAVQHQLSRQGLATLGHSAGPFAETLIVDGAPGPLGSMMPSTAGDSAGSSPTLGRVVQWNLPVRFAGTPIETVSLADAESLRAAVLGWIGDAE